MEANYDGYNYLYCVGNSTILTLSLVNTLIAGFLLVHHLRLKGASNWRVYFKVKSLILIMMTVFAFSVFWRYLVNFDWAH